MWKHATKLPCKADIVVDASNNQRNYFKKLDAAENKIYDDAANFLLNIKATWQSVLDMRPSKESHVFTHSLTNMNPDGTQEL